MTKLGKEGKVANEKVVSSTKSLGTKRAWDGSWNTERKMRVSAARKGLACFKKLFQKSKVAMKIKQTIFRCIVQSSLLYAVEIAPVSKKDIDVLELTEQLPNRVHGKICFSFG